MVPTAAVTLPSVLPHPPIRKALETRSVSFITKELVLQCLRDKLAWSGKVEILAWTPRRQIRLPRIATGITFQNVIRR